MGKRKIAVDTVSFTVTVPRQAAEMIDELVPIGLYGSSRAEIARTLISSQLEELVAKGIAKLRA